MNIVTNLLTWVIFGSAIGGIAYILEPSLRNEKPFLMGIAGTIVTGIAANLLLNIPLQQFSLISFSVAIFGACFLVIGTGVLRNI